MTDFTFFFCTDGSLKIQYFNQEPLIDVQFLIDEQFDGDAQTFWLRWKNTQAVFEKGLTVANFLKALEPYHEFWSNWCGKKIIEFIAEAKKPHLIADEDLFSWIELRWHHYISPKAEYQRDKTGIDEKKLNIKEMIMQPTKVRLTNSVDFERYMAINAYKEGEDEHYGLSGVKINDIANIIICLKSSENIIIGNTYEKTFPKMGKLLNENHIGVHKYDKADAGIGKQTWLETPAYYTIVDVIEGFFSEMEYSLEARDKHTAFLQKIITQFMEDPKYKDITQATTPQEIESNVNRIIDIEDTEDTKNGQGMLDISDTKEGIDVSNVVSIKSGEPLAKKEIEEMQSDYSPVSYLKEQSQWWEEIKQKYSKQVDVVKMAPKELSVSLNNRLYGRVIKDDGQTTTDWVDN